MTPDIGLTSHVGMEREINQDCAGVREVSPGVWLVIVADGMGGHVAGEVAAQLVVESLLNRFDTHGAEDPRDNLYFGILDAHNAVIEYGARHDTGGMGSTVVAAVLTAERAWIAHVGDSRLYQLRDGAVEFMTTDHTRVQMMLEMRLITPEQAKDHPEGNVITRAVGHNPATKGATFEADVRAEPLDWRDGDSLLLCSDGLYDLVDDREMVLELAGRTAEEGSQRLVDLANRRGGHDNVTVLVVHRSGGVTAPRALALPTDGRVTVQEDNAAFTTLEDSIEAPALLDVTVDEQPVAKAPTTQPEVPPVGRSEDQLRPIVLGLAVLVAVLVGVVIYLVVKGGSPPADHGAPDPPALVDDDDSATDDDDSGDDDSAAAPGDDDSAVP